MKTKNIIKSLFINNASSFNYMEVASFAGHKFRFVVEFSNGDPCGFNYKQAISIMTADGKWERLADSKEVGCSVENYYYGSNDAKRIAYRKKVLEGFHDYITKIYGE